MAASEARAAWQRMSNRCFVHEDAKRAPKLACYPSSSSLPSNSQYESSGSDTEHATDHPVSNAVTFNQNNTNSSLSPDTKWWLRKQPNFGHQKDTEFEKLDACNEEQEHDVTESISPSPILNKSYLPCLNVDAGLDKNASSSLDSSWIKPTLYMKHDSRIKSEESHEAISDSQQEHSQKNLDGCCFGDDELMDWNVVDHIISSDHDMACYSLQPHWIGGEKSEPWWKMVDKDELSLLVAQKSQQRIENCDLPPPNNVNIYTETFDCHPNSGKNGIFSPAYSQSLHAGISNPIDDLQKKNISSSLHGKKLPHAKPDYSLSDTEKWHSYSDPCESKMVIENSQAKRHASDSDTSKEKLMEALRHSQTRAREAEMAAKKAYTDKEHIIKLFLKQASHLFAYKQWLRLLQLESLYLQLRLKEQQISTLLPGMSWIPLKGIHLTDEANEVKPKRNKKRRCRICRYVVAFFVGLGLAGAGSLLGWTLGCLLPV